MNSKSSKLKNKENAGILVIWLFHISAIIGISLGFQDWFIEKTPMNLTLMFVLLIWVMPIRSITTVSLAVLFFISGMLVEWLGVNYGLPFGTYSYGENLGIKLDGVPLIIGVNWAMLVFITAILSNRLGHSFIIKVTIGAGLMVLLDFFMEYNAPRFDFWEFAESTAPLSNYLSWFGVSLILQAVFQWRKTEGNFRFSLHLYLAQLLFFSYFYVFYHL